MATPSTATPTELGYSSGVTSAIQTQINSKAATAGGALTGAVSFYRTSSAGSPNSANETIIGITDTSSARTVTLQTADKVNGRFMIIKDESGAAGTNHITIATQSGNIDGVSSATISVNYGCLRVYSDGTNWFSV